MFDRVMQSLWGAPCNLSDSTIIRLMIFLNLINCLLDMFDNVRKKQFLIRRILFCFSQDHSVSVDGKSTDFSLVSSVLEEMKSLLLTPP